MAYTELDLVERLQYQHQVQAPDQYNCHYYHILEEFGYYVILSYRYADFSLIDNRPQQK